MERTGVEWWWIEIGESGAEVAAIVTEDGKKVAYTAGCPDPFVIEPDSGIHLVSKVEKVVSCQTCDTKRKNELRIHQKNLKGHGWKRFGQ